jgi:alanine racemase
MRAHTRLEVYWARLARNWQRVQQLAPSARILPMIKANAYGHGLVPVGQFLSQEMKVETLGVATLGEAEAFLQETPSYRGRVMVFSETNLIEKEFHSRYNSPQIIPVVHDMPALEVFLHDRCYKHLPLVMKLNTGMNRLGIEENDWEVAGRTILKSGRKSIHHLMSHFAYSYSEYKEGDRTHRQVEAFQRGVALLRGMGISIEETSLANSGAIEQGIGTTETWVRPGLMLYGPHSFAGETEMVSSLVTHVMSVFPVKRGVPVGYGNHVTSEDGIMAILPLGYGDGFPTQSTGYRFSVNGAEARVFGRINMDMVFLFFPGASPGVVKAGDEVRFWDTDPRDVDAWARHMDTHAYQAMCSISSRVPRIYRLG